MQHRMIGVAALGVAATALCAVFASTALASPSAPAKSQAIKQEQATVRTGVKAQTPAGRAAKAKAKGGDENEQLLQIQYAVKATTSGPTSAQIAKENKLVEQLKAKGKATADQLAWLALSPAQKRLEVVQVPSTK